MSQVIIFDFFQRKVNETAMSGNVDAPEGSFDAIMQVITCKVSSEIIIP
jgi:hypothetical protein